MRDTPPPVLDAARLAALHRLALLDTEAEESFDRLTRLATRLLKVPVSLVSLVDVDRQFFKSSVGLPDPWASRRQTPLSHSFCQYAVATAAPVVVEDAREDPLLHDNLGIVDLGVVAYAGIPLVTDDGDVIGSFCAIDSVPRRWSGEELAILHDLAAMAMNEIRLRAMVVDQARARRHLEAQHAVSLRLATSDSIEEAARGVLRALCEGLGWELGALWEADGASLRCVELWAGPGLDAPRFVAATKDRVLAAGQGLPGSVLASSGPRWVEDAATAADLPRVAAAREDGLHAAVAFPIVVKGRTLGVIELFATTRRKEDPELVRVVATTGSHIGLFLERRQAQADLLASRERFATLARTLQRSLLPGAIPRIDGLELHAGYHAGGGDDVGGDFYDVVALGERGWALCVGDVCGKGAAAAAITSLVRYSIRAALLEGHGAAGALDVANRALLSEGLEERFCSATVIHLQPLDGSAAAVAGASAGHPLPVVRRSGGSVERLGTPAPVLGVLGGARYATEGTTLGKGDAVVLYTDGVTEARQGHEQFGEERLAAVITASNGTAASIVEAVEEAVWAFSDGPSDDRAVVALRVVGPRAMADGTRGAAGGG